MTNFLDSLPEVPGDPVAVKRFAHVLGAAAETVDGHANRLRSSVASLVGVGWRSPAADRFASFSSTLTDDLRAVGGSYREAAGVLSRYGAALELAQQARAAAQRQLDEAKVEAAVVDVGLPMFSGVEDFNPAVRQAHTQADEAVHYVRLMAGAARAALETLAGLPVQRPGPAPQAAVRVQHWYDRCLGFGQDFGEGLYDGFKAQAVMGWDASAGHLLIDPGGSVQFLRDEGDIGELAGKHPSEFARSLIDWSDWTSGHQGRAAGELAASAVTTAALGLADGDPAGAAVAVREAPASAPIRLPPSESWGRAATLAKHFRDHGADFGSASEADYAERASAFLQSSQALGSPTKIDSAGVIRVYDPMSNIFGAFNPDGTTRTFFRPDPGTHGYLSDWDYWAAQQGREVRLG